MFIKFDKNKASLENIEFQKISYKNFVAYYQGIIWKKRKKAGKNTVISIIDEYIKSNNINFIDIYGAFSIVIVKPDNTIIFFTDNSNMRCFFIGNRTVSSSFLEIAKVEKIDQFDTESIYELLKFGCVYFGKTLLKGISISESDKFYVIKNEKCQCIDKKIGGIDNKTSIDDVNTFFEEMADALSECNITLSLTGGYDSRMVFACLNNYVPIDLFISGDNDEDSDIKIAKKVSEIANKDIDVIKVKKPKELDKKLNNFFEDADGVVSFVNNGFMRINNFLHERANKGYDCYLTGDGGVLHKDWWWIQDFPFYKKRNTNMKKFYSQRIDVFKVDGIFGKELKKYCDFYENDFYKKCKKYLKKYNSESYDSLYFSLNGKKTAINYNSDGKLINIYAPLWELELVRYSYHLPRTKRFYYNSMRTVTTKASPQIAKVKTNSGATESSQIRYILRDCIFFSIDYCKKAIRMLGRKLLKKNFFVGNPTTWSIEKEIRDANITNQALEFCKKCGFLNDKITLSELSFSVVGAIVQIYLLSIYLEN
ncbi:hypothetical protein SAMN04515624_10514 [Eubacterium maltosivorans]|uniref:hypothetical protein n=1 Tax=Eubacterium maltosivorans TaxID=2041044 RepID=UPI00088F6BA3|nr:hypothetical protein [Eubacterium maltosivorans]WPK79903.1 hypothetical protein EUMA32_13130 [Eubacterium maltosivorans]SDO96951.1 hypothetical protein SAMN04515624_10514 [Eubacterium maltosivorans]